jgi:oligosaccharide repeat unit polymerase
MILLPFARSEMNGIVLKTDLYPVIDAIPFIFIVVLVGYLFVLLGGCLWHMRIGLGIRNTANRFLNIFPRLSIMLMSSKNLLVFQSIICLIAQTGILSFYFANNGFGFNLRQYTFENPMLRPIASSISSYSTIIASHCLARYIDTKEKILLYCTLFSTVGMIFFGTRGNIANIYMGVLFCCLIKLRSRVGVLKIFIYSVIIISIAFYLGNLRAGNYSIVDFLSGFAVLLFYGNNFSDLRDFAWVYVKWDHVPWAGKTYLAAATAFIPRFISSFRDTWSLGATTAATAGFDPQTHPGLRPGGFGEGYLNFGFLGVVVVGIIMGLIIKKVDIDTKNALSQTQSPIMKSFASLSLLNIATMVSVSNASSSVYVLVGVYFISWFFLCMGRMVKII